MKKITFVLILAAIFCFNTNPLKAQAFEKGSMVLNLGVGVGGQTATGIGVNGSFEVGLWETGSFGIIGLGVMSSYLFASEVIISSDVNYTEFGIGARGTYHFTVIPVENLDVYAVVQLVFNNETTKYNSSFLEDTNQLLVYPGLIAGVRYYFSDFFGVFGELGYSVTYVTGGIALKF